MAAAADAAARQTQLETNAAADVQAVAEIKRGSSSGGCNNKADAAEANAIAAAASDATTKQTAEANAAAASSGSYE
jgi:hypothetical protein